MSTQRRKYTRVTWETLQDLLWQAKLCVHCLRPMTKDKVDVRCSANGSNNTQQRPNDRRPKKRLTEVDKKQTAALQPSTGQLSRRRSFISLRHNKHNDVFCDKRHHSISVERHLQKRNLSPRRPVVKARRNLSKSGFAFAMRMRT